ncbi:hypothetical protein BRADI_4g42785v3 [Brachypodium distachyon]|uniref:Uncharacterized protein n=1 Tax=Brachypodium distachyon TaxID=15368 RepID=A0A0Q3LIB6_BRADI|nr:hypothetical protein BRADI_4g42785v3 [Brachypodium distachyon]
MVDPLSFYRSKEMETKKPQRGSKVKWGRRQGR